MSGHPHNVDVWRSVTQVKDAALALLHSTNDGVRTQALKFIQKLIYCFTEAPVVRAPALPVFPHAFACCMYRSWPWSDAAPFYRISPARAWTSRARSRSTLFPSGTRSWTDGACTTKDSSTCKPFWRC